MNDGRHRVTDRQTDIWFKPQSFFLFFGVGKGASGNALKSMHYSHSDTAKSFFTFLTDVSDAKSYFSSFSKQISFCKLTYSYYNGRMWRMIFLVHIKWTHHRLPSPKNLENQNIFQKNLHRISPSRRWWIMKHNILSHSLDFLIWFWNGEKGVLYMNGLCFKSMPHTPIVASMFACVHLMLLHYPIQ